MSFKIEKKIRHEEREAQRRFHIEKGTPRFEYLCEAVEKGYAYIKKVEGYEAPVIVKPFFLLMKDHYMLCDEIGCTVLFGLWKKSQ